MYDYAEDAPKPTPEALSRLYEMADQLVDAPKPLKSILAEEIVEHMGSNGIPLWDFESPSGRKFAVNLVTSGCKPSPGRETELEAWLGGRKLDSAVRHALANGQAIPNDVLCTPRYVVKPK